MISDHVKGKTRFDYPPGIQRGIHLHREIDRFTDAHPATREAKTIFRPDYRLYSGAIVDVIYDYFLANDDSVFTGATLLQFSHDTYASLERYASWFPERFAHLYPFMKQQNWLYHYREKEGLAKSLHGLVRRSTYLTESQTAFLLFEEHIQLLEGFYRLFWTDVLQYARNTFNNSL
jgi:acyl carrier protein phosphodiesterase